MRVVHSKHPLPAVWSNHPKAPKNIVSECDIGISRRSRLRMKLMVFRNRWALHRFWRDVLHKDHRERLGRGCIGVVNALATQYVDIAPDTGKETRRLEVDPRYFCVMGLVCGYKSKLGNSPMEVVSHESVHAAFAYANRVNRRDFFSGGKGNVNEDWLAYPAGRIAAAVNRYMHKRDLY